MADYRDYGFPDAGAAHTHQYLQKLLLDFLSAGLKNRKILDLGCGNGALVRFLLDKGYDAYGTDASEQGINIALNLNPDRFAWQDLASDGLPDKLSSHHLNTIISFCKNILAKNGGGDLILSTPYHGYFKNLLIGITGKWDSHMSPLWDGGHIKMWSAKSLNSLLTENGFKVTGFAGCGRFPYLWKSMLVKATLT